MRGETIRILAVVFLAGLALTVQGCSTHGTLDKRIDTVNEEIEEKGYQTEGRPYLQDRYLKNVR